MTNLPRRNHDERAQVRELRAFVSKLDNEGGTPNYAPLWQWINAREKARIVKEVIGAPPPYTTDPVIAKYRFCNVRREDDRGTVWVRQHIREPFADHPNLWFMLCIARQINWPDTLAEMIARAAWPSNPNFHPSMMTTVLRERKARGEKVFTGAYMISAGPTKGQDKATYICEHVLGNLKANAHIGDVGYERLRSVHYEIKRHNGWGDFMAYQAVVDMRFTRILRDAIDRESWAAAGPGTIRGLNRLYGRALTAPLSQTQALDEMSEIYPLVRPMTGVAIDFSDVPNILCETDKYLRVMNGEGTPRAMYVPGRGC